MTLDGLEAKLAEKFPKARRAGLKMNMVRYADDCVPRTRDPEHWESRCCI